MKFIKVLIVFFMVGSLLGGRYVYAFTLNSTAIVNIEIPLKEIVPTFSIGRLPNSTYPLEYNQTDKQVEKVIRSITYSTNVPSDVKHKFSIHVSTTLEQKLYFTVCPTIIGVVTYENCRHKSPGGTEVEILQSETAQYKKTFEEFFAGQKSLTGGMGFRFAAPPTSSETGMVTITTFVN